MKGPAIVKGEMIDFSNQISLKKDVPVFLVAAVDSI
jgi:hypothetical protein